MEKSSMPECDREGNTMLHRSASEGNEKLVRLMVDRGCDVNARNKTGQTALFNALTSRTLNMNILKILVEAGADVYELNSKCDNALFISVKIGSLEAVKYFVSAKVCSKWSHYYKMIALRLAIVRGLNEIAMVLIKCGITLKSSILYFTILGQNQDLLNYFLESKMNVNCVSDQGETPLHYACNRENSNLGIIKTLLEHGADVNVENRKGYTALHQAVINSNLEAMDLLLQYGADKNASSPVGSILHLAANTNHENSYEVMKFLFNIGIDCNAANNNELTPFHFAIMNTDQIRVIDLFLQHGADFNVKTKNGSGPIHCVMFNRNEDIIEYVLDILIKKSICEIDDQNDEGDTPLHFAAVSDHPIGCVSVLKRGANVNIRNSQNLTPLLVAMKRQNIPVLEWLLISCKDTISLSKSDLIFFNRNSNYYNEDVMRSIIEIIAHWRFQNLYTFKSWEMIIQYSHTFGDYYDFCMNELAAVAKKKITIK